MLKTGWWWVANQPPAETGLVAYPQQSPPNIPAGHLPVAASQGEPDKVTAVELTLDAKPGSSVTTELVSVGSSMVRVVQWTNFVRGAQLGVPNPGSITFQIQLWDNGDIVTAYKNLSWGNQIARGYYHGKDAAIAGIENPLASQGYVFTVNKPVVYDGLSILIDKR